jgi:hypothetical protein
MSKGNPEQEQTADVDRRSLLRTGGAAVMAGVAGLAIAETATAPSADAASGGSLVMGTANDSGSDPTSLTSASTTIPTFTLANTGLVAPLHLTSATTPTNGNAFTPGDLFNFDGDLYYTDSTSGTAFVYTADTATQVVTIIPVRILDTRTVAGRSHITHPAGNLDSAGRLLAGHSITINLATLEVGATAAFCNLSAVAPLAAGYLTLWPGSTRPPTSSVNFAAHAVVSNFAVTGTSFSDTVAIFSSATTHMLLDITAFAVGYTDQIVTPTLASPSKNETGQRLAAHAKAGTLPQWFRRL